MAVNSLAAYTGVRCETASMIVIVKLETGNVVYFQTPVGVNRKRPFLVIPFNGVK